MRSGLLGGRLGHLDYGRADEPIVQHESGLEFLQDGVGGHIGRRLHRHRFVQVGVEGSPTRLDGFDGEVRQDLVELFADELESVDEGLVGFGVAACGQRAIEAARRGRYTSLPASSRAGLPSRGGLIR